ncbi:MAG: hypothetical protein ACJ77K_04165 [Bacteroidia bacterium]
MKFTLAVIFATVYGLVTRLLFGAFDEFMSIMGIVFLGLIPLIVGFLTVFPISANKKINGAAAFFLPWLTSVVILIVTVALNVEGTICWVLIFPFFATFAGLGGLIAMAIRNKRDKNNQEPPKPTVLNISLALFIPLIAGYFEGNRTLSPEQMTITQEIIIPVSKEQVWNVLTNINELKQEERSSSFSHWLGFPHHISTTLDSAKTGGKRIACYEKGLCIEETIISCKEKENMLLRVDVDPSKVPPNVMDEHIVIGGKYVDILEDSYSLEELSSGTTRLKLSSKFVINTPFNWYAGIWSKYLMKDILSGELALINKRCNNLK